MLIRGSRNLDWLVLTLKCLLLKNKSMNTSVVKDVLRLESSVDTE